MSRKLEALKRPLAQGLTMAAPEVAEALGVHRATVYSWLRQGIFPRPTIKVGRVVRWSRATVEKFASEGVQA